MAKRPKKAMIFGLDAPMSPRLYKYCKEGKLPALAKVINGVWGKNSMVPLPSITPANWSSIATGAWPSTSGITCFDVHIPGEALDRTHGGFFSGDLQAEPIWDALARAGKRSVVANYPGGSWPPTSKNVIQLGGAGIEINQWFYPALLYSAEGGLDQPIDEALVNRFAPPGRIERRLGGAPIAYASLSYDRLFSAKKWFRGPGSPLLIELKEPTGWSNVPPAKKAMEVELEVRPSMPLYQMETPVWQMLVLDTRGNGYDKVIICDSKDASSPMAELEVGQWGPIITRDFQTEAGVKRASFTFKLVELSKDAEDLKLYHSAICCLDGWSYPASLAAEIKSEKGLPYPQHGFFQHDRGWFDADTVLEVMEYERQWWSDALTYVLKNKPWDFFIMQYHPPDHAFHSISWLMDPATAKDEAEVKKYQAIELKMYQMCDRLAADLFACADEDETIFALVSDHGAKATTGPNIDIDKILQDAGMQAKDENGNIDWSKTKAARQRSVYVYINLKGRDPEGIVEPEDYSKVQEQVIHALIDYVEPEKGKRPIVFALRKEDARFINIYGDRVGDVVFAINEHFGGQHGIFLPTTKFGLGSVGGLFAMTGPGLKKGVELERNVWCLDMVPTICYLAGWPMPKDAEGAIIFQALEDPDLT